ncbi:MAG: IMPACT family protein, partial [Halothiobacillaceae bacterium]
PSGTAGKPILNVLQHKGVGDVMLIVVRYFGGIKLGAGGLTRAYGQAAQAVMEVLPIEKREPRTTLMVRCDFAQEQGIRHWLSLHGGQVTGVDYGQDVRVQLELPETALADWLAYGRAHGIKSSQGD